MSCQRYQLRELDQPQPIRFFRNGELIETYGAWRHFAAQPGDILEIESGFWVVVTHLTELSPGCYEIHTALHRDNRPAVYSVPADSGIPAPVRWGLNALGAYAKWADRTSR